MQIRTLLTILALLAACTVGCDRSDDDTPAPAHTAPAATRSATVTPETEKSSGPRIVFLGDSLTAGLGVDVNEAFPAVIDRLLEEEGLDVTVINAGQSGDTTAGGLRRVDWLLRQRPDVIVVGLGGNDGLRGIDVRSSEENLRGIVTRARDAGASVLLLGMLIPPNYGPEYTTAFRDVYPRIAKDLGVPLVPFLLEGVGGEEALNQRDGIHPTADGHQVIARTVLPYLRDVLRERAATQPTTSSAL